MPSIRSLAGGSACVSLPAVRATADQVAALRRQVAAPPPVPAADQTPPCRGVGAYCPEVLPVAPEESACPCCGRPRLTSVPEVLRAAAQLGAAAASLLPLLDTLRAGLPLLPADREQLGARRHDLGTALQIAVGLGLVSLDGGRWVAGEVSRG